MDDDDDVIGWDDESHSTPTPEPQACEKKRQRASETDLDSSESGIFPDDVSIDPTPRDDKSTSVVQEPRSESHEPATGNASDLQLIHVEDNSINEREASTSVDRPPIKEESFGITIVTLNIGGHPHIMNTEGTPSEHFVALLGCVQGPAIICLCDVRLKENDMLWLNFIRILRTHAPRYTVRALRGARESPHMDGHIAVRGGCCIIVTREFKTSPIQPTPPGCDHVELHILGWNKKDSKQRLVILNTYFPFNLNFAERAAGTCNAASNQVAAGNIVIITGDLNQQQLRAHKAKYRTKAHKRRSAENRDTQLGKSRW